MQLRSLFRTWLAPLVLLVCAASAGAQTTAAAPAALAPPQAREYILGGGDVIKVTVFQSPELSVETRVSESGAVTYPLLGSVQLGGLSVSAAEQRISDGLRTGNFIKQPQVSILVVTVRGNQVSVLGQVNKPGRYPLEQANMRLSDVLALAGGIMPTGSDVVVVTGARAGKPFRSQVDLPSVFMTNSTATPQGQSSEVIVENGDVVYVDRMPMIYIYGEVQKAGQYRLERGMTVIQALAAGGGLNLRGTEKGIRVNRRGPDGKVAQITPAMDEPLRDGDVVYVRESLF
jgi:polysaccharide export outer membrane protein